MTRDEHRDIIAFIEGAVRRDGSAQAPLDVEADAIIRALFVRNPEAAYRITKLAMAQLEELAVLKSELAEVKASDRQTWFSRILNKKNRERRSRMDPDFSLFPQDARRG